MIHARKIARVHTKNNFHDQSTGVAIIKNTKIAMIYKLKLPHGNFSLSTMVTTV